MARSLNIVIGADIEKLQKGFNDAVSVVQSSGKKMSEAAAETAKSIQDRLASIATKNPTAGTVRQLTARSGGQRGGVRSSAQIRAQQSCGARHRAHNGFLLSCLARMLAHAF